MILQIMVDAADDKLEYDELDSELQEWEKEEEFNVFYKASVTDIRYFFIYMKLEGNNHAIKYVTSGMLKFVEDSSTLDSRVLMSLIKNHETHRKKRYKLSRILKYNLTLDTEEVERIWGSEMVPDVSPYFTESEGFMDIPFSETIELFRGHNALYLFMSEEQHATDRVRSRRVRPPRIIRRTRRMA